jgi:hypothetical protein
VISLLRNLMAKRAAGREENGLQQVAVLGAMRCGTNLTRHLLETHWEVSAAFSPFGWKHAGLPILNPDSGLAYPETPILYLVKDPSAFALSLYHYRMQAITKGHRVSIEGADTLEGFLTRPIVIFDSQLPHSPKMRFANPLQYWNYVYWNLETLDRRRYRVRGLNYEDLIRRPESLRVVEEISSLRRRQPTITLPQQRIGRGTDGEIGLGAEADFDAGYYAERRYLQSFTAEQLRFIRGEVDPWLMEKRGYEMA